MKREVVFVGYYGIRAWLTCEAYRTGSLALQGKSTMEYWNRFKWLCTSMARRNANQTRRRTRRVWFEQFHVAYRPCGLWWRVLVCVCDLQQLLRERVNRSWEQRRLATHVWRLCARWAVRCKSVRQQHRYMLMNQPSRQHRMRKTERFNISMQNAQLFVIYSATPPGAISERIQF